MKKILIIHSSGDKSGGEAISLSIYQKLNNRFKFIFFIPKSQKSSSFLCDAQILYPKKNNFLSIICNLRKKIKDLKPDILHAHGTKAAFYTKISLILCRKKPLFIYTIHGFHIFHRKGLKIKFLLLIEKILNSYLVDKLICVGEDDFNILKQISRKNNDIRIIKNGIKINTTKASSAEIEKVKQKFKNIIGTISRLHYQKDVETIIKSANLIENAGLIIIGSGPAEESLRNLTKKLNLENKIFFFGNINNASSLIHYFDAFILSTKWEGLPLVILESMVANIPVIASNVHGVKEIIIDSKNGFLFKQGDHKELAEKICYILENKDDLKKLTNSAYNTVANKYSEERMIEEYKNLYLE